jgi:hypothetical protein
MNEVGAASPSTTPPIERPLRGDVGGIARYDMRCSKISRRLEPGLFDAHCDDLAVSRNLRRDYRGKTDRVGAENRDRRSRRWLQIKENRTHACLNPAAQWSQEMQRQVIVDLPDVAFCRQRMSCKGGLREEMAADLASG